MGRQVPTNKLTVFLIKEEYVDEKDILKDKDKLQLIDLDAAGKLYFGDSFNFKPSWLEKFFGSSLGNSAEKLFNASSKAILITRVQISEGKERIFAIPFGYGWTFLAQGVWEERFGLKTTLNVIDSNNLRRIDKNNMSSVPKIASEQLSKDGVAADFGIDIEQDLIKSVTGRTKDDRFGKIITGKDALNLTARISLASLPSFLKDCYEKFESADYKKNFGWIDQISEIRDPRIVNRLNATLITNVKNNQLDKIWMAVPELIDWSDVSGFAYRQKKENLKDDIGLAEFLSVLPEAKKSALSLETFNSKVYCFGASSDEVKYQWKAFNCLYCEIQDGPKNKTYILSNGKWYEIESNFSAQINAEYQKLRSLAPSISLPAFNCKNENEYNKQVADGNGSFCCMDKNLIMHGGGLSSIEFCDLYEKGKKIIHVKKYGGSSVLSHLFSQGIVSGELFIADADFRKKVNDKLPDDRKINNPDHRPNPSDFEIIFAIISTKPKNLEIPFFSKVSLRNAKRRLESYGYKVSLQKIGAE